MEFFTELKCGNSRKKVDELALILKDINGQNDEWHYHVICQGAINEDKVLEGNSAFDCLVLGLAFLRQSLRNFQEQNPKIKFYELAGDELEIIEIEDIFWTHDCVPD